MTFSMNLKFISGAHIKSDDPAAPACASLGWDEGWLGHSGRVNPGQDMTGCLLSNHQQPGAPDPAACRAACCNDTRCRSWGLDLRHPGDLNGCADGTPCCWLERCVGLSAAAKSNCSWGCVSGRSGRADDPQQCGKCTDTSCACCGAACAAPGPLPPSPPNAKAIPEICSNGTGGYFVSVTNRSLGPAGGAIISKANLTSDFACTSCLLGQASPLFDSRAAARQFQRCLLPSQQRRRPRWLHPACGGYGRQRASVWPTLGSSRRPPHWGRQLPDIRACRPLESHHPLARCVALPST